MYSDVVERLLKYVKIDSPSDRLSDKFPSTDSQVEFAKKLVEELKEVGVQDVVYDNYYIIATIPANTKNVPSLAFVTHYDVCTDAPATGIKPRIIENYDGGEILFPADEKLKLNSEVDPRLAACKGHTLILTDGSTLLGADCKAGIALSIELAKFLLENPDYPHGMIRFIIGPDEELGVSITKLDISKSRCDYGYTLDGPQYAKVWTECFNADKVTVNVKGMAAFPGRGQKQFTDASQMLCEMLAKVPLKYDPYYADGRDGIMWIQMMKGKMDKASAMVMVRDFDINKLEEMEEMIRGFANGVLAKYPNGEIDIEVKELYRNYKVELDKRPEVVENALEAFRRIGVKPEIGVTRGGNDCTHLCEKGIISAHISIGYNLCHSVREWISIQQLEKNLEMVKELPKVWVEKSS